MPDPSDAAISHKDATAEGETKNETVVEEPPSLLDGTAGSEIIIFLVGSDEKRYAVHRALLCYYSPYFTAALNDCSNNEGIPPASSGGPDESHDYCMTGLFIFAEFYNVPQLRKEVVDQFYFEYACSGVSILPDYQTIIQAFSSLPDTSPFCRFLVRIYAVRWDVSYDEDDDEAVDNRGQLPKEFLGDLMVEVGKVRKDQRKFGKAPAMPEVCEYHEHSTKEEKTSCRRTQRIENAAKKAAKEARTREEMIVDRELRHEELRLQERLKRKRT
ncbi:hypothetical protein W97_01908 [Coniosporium apollinis CBS 100218]|uniref:BTB domain-containing protein n=1 Tax=Coniosporium apollinis (strain CBS 100218) TaxID=1168221 RepID=R7YLK3_CONA1|nr:uncharacterized protein W97_01908 [Coniosporium apollinis CBS 100218]EON62684.1 hypothetical protein W97_01908 [Coniosporium apollinis CBS 100218]